MLSIQLATLTDFLRRGESRDSSVDQDLPMRSELFSAEQMEQYGRTLASWHRVSVAYSHNRLLWRLSENEKVLTEAVKLLADTVKENVRITPAGEWLLDNFYLVEEQIRLAKKHLPYGYSRELPHVLNGPYAGMPRVYNLALEAISHGDGKIDLRNLSRFVAAYQTVTKLKLGELWAIPIMLRLALIENLRRVAARISAAKKDRQRADAWAEQMIKISQTDPKSLILVVADMARSDPPMVSSFVAELTRQLQGHGPDLALPLSWIEQRLAENGLTIEQLVQSETQQQAADQVSVSNSIGSLRVLGATDWRRFVESNSAVEETLCKDPSGIYQKMDFATRDQYRHVIEKICKENKGLSETDLAASVLELAQDAASKDGTDPRLAHVGYYLIDKGRAQTERTNGLQKSTLRVLFEAFQEHPLFCYLGTIFGATAAITYFLLQEIQAKVHPEPLLILLGITIALGSSQLALALVNWLLTLFATPNQIPKLDFVNSIPVEASTMVVVPTMLVNQSQVDELLEALEVRFAANQDPNLFFALLTDFLDANEETKPDDDALVKLAEKGINDLNKKHGREAFFLFHRPRVWNPRERVWMGYERKRGKLSALNSLILGIEPDKQNRFSVVSGNTEQLTKIKYVITLDTDTQLPRDTARELVGAMMHPLNKAIYNEQKQRVTDGYAILQPRVALSLSGDRRSIYSTLFGSENGLDPYTCTVSDVYQDIFAEGSFIGKGIYEVGTFEQVLRNRFPENSILSHDLIEGCYLRSALVTDIQLFERYPSSYSADMARKYRWIRGDWQLLFWLFPFIPLADASWQKNPLTSLSKWKLFDNLRRSLLPPALMLLLLVGWALLAKPWFWTATVLAFVTVPFLVASAVSLLRKPDDMQVLQHLDSAWQSTLQDLAQALFTMAQLPYEASLNLRAIVCTIWRIFVSRQHLLEWVTSSHVEACSSTALTKYCSSMLIATVAATATFLYLLCFRAEALPAASAVLLLWFLAPVLAWKASKTLIPKGARLTQEQVWFLRKLSRKTWAFFEVFAGPEDNWLPPDNYQEGLVERVAHRTSPTNMGLSLLANLSAYDFAYIQAGEFIDRTEKAFQSFSKLDRHRGHFYNWYDTVTLQCLHPQYISTVDSGNLAGDLLTLRPALLWLAHQPIIRSQLFDGLQDASEILAVSIETEVPGFAQFQIDLQSASEKQPENLSSMSSLLLKLGTQAQEIASWCEKNGNEEAIFWSRTVARQCANAREELVYLAPWVLLDSSNLDKTTLDLLNRITITLEELAMLELPGLAFTEQVVEQVQLGSLRAAQRLAQIKALAAQSSEFAAMDFEFLYDKSRHLLSIGFNAELRRLDTSYYDLLASEARLSNFIAIAQGQLPQESWFSLGRLLAAASGEPALMSWSGSMFEYLMPLLLMPSYENTLLDQTYKAVIKRQKAYGIANGVPWGVSESGYSAVDGQSNYQYRAFGVPGLGLKRGLSEDLVIAPYASALALMVAPEDACQNLQALSALGSENRYGFYEAIDYTRSRLPRGKNHVLVQSYMAHHQGMTFLSLAYLLLGKKMQERFQSDPAIQATTLLLQERIPKTGVYHLESEELTGVRLSTVDTEQPLRIFRSPNTQFPELQLLSNSRYNLMMTNAGGGYSRWNDIALTRWTEDSTCDNAGSFCYVRDLATGEFWSVTHQPTKKKADEYEAVFSDSRIEFRRRDNDLLTYTELVVSSEDDIELRRVRITNHSQTSRVIDITSYAEIVLAKSVGDAMHPAFSKLFVQTEIIAARQAILCTRRARSPEEQPPWMFHLLTVQAKGKDSRHVSYETDRSKFIGRGNTLESPEAMLQSSPLSGSQGSVLDPIVAIRCYITIEPEGEATFNFITGVAGTRDAATHLLEKYSDRSMSDRVFDLAWSHSQALLHQLNANDSDAQLYSRLASAIVFANAALRADASTLIKNRRGQSGLWSFAISGDLPIVLVKIRNQDNIELVRQLVQAHAYWRIKGLAVDLVIWNEDHAGYRQQLQEQILGLVSAGGEVSLDRPGGIFIRAAEQISEEDRILLHSVARAIISDNRGTLEEQLNRRPAMETRVAPLKPGTSHRQQLPSTGALRRDLILGNGLGGFTTDGREYIITTSHEQRTPAPWCNIIANPYFGCIISDSGSGYTWCENAHEYRLSPWSNDPVCDTSGEAIYIRDEQSGYFWSPTPSPASGSTPYVTRHGFGYTAFEHAEDGIISELWVHVAIDAPVKFYTLKVRNASGRSRSLSATIYIEWVLGDLRSKSAMHISTELDARTGALFARNPYNTEFARRVAFLDVDGASGRIVTGDRNEFIGRNGTLKRPAAMFASRLSGKVGAGLDPCGVMQIQFELAEGEEREFVFRIGAAADSNDAVTLVRRFRGAAARLESFEAACQYWKHTLGAVNIDSPDRSLNMLVNGWLLYQTIACRLYGRSGFYQSGGAFGFRDQLQDTMALVHAEPRLLREQILRSAARQFSDGDVQHWWHPPTGRGVRTRCSDDYLWLPLAVQRYVECTGDTGVLDELMPFLEGRKVNLDEDSYYDLPVASDQKATLYEHCVRAIKNGLRFGSHGLPLILTGDWNDGMNLVGEKGQGESVWLGFFLYHVLVSFSRIAELRNDTALVELCRTEASKLRSNLQKGAWDGKWYRRAYFDDGTPLGSAQNEECKIDSIAQSWSVLSGAADPEQSKIAMNSLDEHLVRREDALIQLLDPPFDKSSLNPGYIRGYVPGVRENGGQYTHGAIWAAMAFAALGDQKRAWELLSMINPINHASSAADIEKYKVEPYVMAADVYGVAPHTGRGGWTWYTGSGAWMYRFIVESLLGMKIEVNRLRISPCIPAEWSEFKIHYRYRETVHHITIRQVETTGQAGVFANSQRIGTDSFKLHDDGQEHFIEIIVPKPAWQNRDQ